MERIPTGLVPQADRFDKLLDVLEKIRGGVYDPASLAEDCGLPSVRQSNYYRQALYSIGLVEREGRRWKPTELGEEVADIEDNKRKTAVMRAVICLNPAVGLLHDSIARSGEGGMTMRELELILKARTDLGESTAERRVVTIMRWFEFLKMVRKVGDKYVTDR